MPSGRCGTPDRGIPQAMDVQDVGIAQLGGDDGGKRRRVKDGSRPGAAAVTDGDALVFRARDDLFTDLTVPISAGCDDPNVGAGVALGAEEREATAGGATVYERRREVRAHVDDPERHSGCRVED